MESANENRTSHQKSPIMIMNRKNRFNDCPCRPIPSFYVSSIWTMKIHKNTRANQNSRLHLFYFAGVRGSQRKNFRACQNFGRKKFGELMKFIAIFNFSQDSPIEVFLSSESASDQLLLFIDLIRNCQNTHFLIKITLRILQSNYAKNT